MLEMMIPNVTTKPVSSRKTPAMVLAMTGELLLPPSSMGTCWSVSEKKI